MLTQRRGSLGHVCRTGGVDFPRLENLRKLHFLITDGWLTGAENWRLLAAAASASAQLRRTFPMSKSSNSYVEAVVAGKAAGVLEAKITLLPLYDFSH